MTHTIYYCVAIIRRRPCACCHGYQEATGRTQEDRDVCVQCAYILKSNKKTNYEV